MSTPVTYVGNGYNVPTYNDTGYAQGSGNLSSYLIALATGSLTLSGGSFPLTADANFGSSFGLVAKYLKSVSSNIAQSGVIRLANTDAVAWRNNANGADLSLTSNASDQLVFNGTALPAFNTNGDIVDTNAGKGLVCTTPDGAHTVRISVTNLDADGNSQIQLETLS